MEQIVALGNVLEGLVKATSSFFGDSIAGADPVRVDHLAIGRDDVSLGDHDRLSCHRRCLIRS